MPYLLVLLQSYCCEVKYSEKKIGFSHGNLYNLHLLSNSSPAKTWLSIRKRIFSSTSIDTTLMVQVLPNRTSLDFDYFKSRPMRWYTYIQNSQMNLASGVGNPTRPKLVCCEAWWLRSKYMTSADSTCSLIHNEMFRMKNIKIIERKTKTKQNVRLPGFYQQSQEFDASDHRTGFLKNREEFGVAGLKIFNN